MKNKQTRMLSVFITLVLGSIFLVQITHAQTSDDSGISFGIDGDNTIEIGTFAPTSVTNLAKYGVLRLGGYIAVLILVWVFIYAIFNLISFAIKWNGENSDDMAEGMRGAEGTMRAVGYTLLMLFAYAIIGIFLGIGNPLKWPNKLAQCGGGEFLFRAEYRAQTVNTEIFDDEALIYCCSKFSGILDESEGEREISIGGHEGDGAVVGTPEAGGWLFISDKTGDYPSTLPVNVSGAEDCEEFTI